MKIKYHYDIEQGTEEWRKLRLGKITASTAKELLTPTFKIANNDKTRSIVYQLASERLTGRLEPNFSSYHTDRGHIEEVFARELYEEKYEPVEECGFLENGSIGYSPDGLVGDNGLIEIKSRVPKYQVKTIINGEVPPEYMIQCQVALLISEREWIDFLQYGNGMHMFKKRVFINEKITNNITEAIKETEEKINQMVEEYKEKSKQYHKAEYIEHVDFGEIEC